MKVEGGIDPKTKDTYYSWCNCQHIVFEEARKKGKEKHHGMGEYLAWDEQNKTFKFKSCTFFAPRYTSEPGVRRGKDSSGVRVLFRAKREERTVR